MFVLLRILLIFLCLSRVQASPNIVLIVADDMGWSDLGCYGSEIRTPSLDSLAEQGMLATRCYTTPRCSPSRASLMTGKYPQMVGMGHLDKDLGKAGYHGYLDKNAPTLPEILKKEKGYRTYMAGKWHLGTGKGKYPWDRGFDRYRGLLSGACGYFGIDEGRLMGEDGKLLTNADLPKDFYMTEDITRTALRYLDDAKAHRGKPFFMYVAYTAPHTPLQARKETIEKYKGKYSDGYAVVRRNRLARQRELGIIPSGLVIPEERALPEATTLKEDLQMAVYAAQITDMDEGIGRLLKKLDESGLEKNTVVIFLSDNGATKEMPARKYSPYPGFEFTKAGYGKNWATVSNTPYSGYKVQTREGGISVPCLVRYPGKVQAGSVRHAPMHFIDLAPTLLGWCGIDKDDEMEGASLSEYLEADGKPDWNKPVSLPNHKRMLFCEHEKNRFVITDEYKLVRNGGKKEPWQLYSLEDRLETKDISAQHPDIVKKLDAAYLEWAKAHHVDETIENYWKSVEK